MPELPGLTREELYELIRQQQHILEELRKQVEELRKQVEELRRKSHRQATPRTSRRRIPNLQGGSKERACSRTAKLRRNKQRTST
jgi:prefoldin subunit 5